MIFKDILELEDLFIHPYNGTCLNERGCEIIWALNWATQHSNFIEVGAVLPYYGFCNHRCIDQYDPHPQSERHDATLMDYTGQNILCISTIEHMGTKDYDPNTPVEPDKAQNFLEKIHREAKNYFITMPSQHNHQLDDYLRKNREKFNIVGYYKISQDPVRWVFTQDLDHLLSFKYHTTFPNSASSIFIYREHNA